MLDCTTLLEQLAALAAQRGRLLQSEAKTWIDVSHALAEFAATVSSKPAAVQPTAASEPNSSLLSTKQAASVLNLTASTLSKWRVHGGGPQFVKLGRSIFYRKAALDSFVASRAHHHTAEYQER